MGGAGAWGKGRPNGGKLLGKAIGPDGNGLTIGGNPLGRLNGGIENAGGGMIDGVIDGVVDGTVPGSG